MKNTRTISRILLALLGLVCGTVVGFELMVLGGCLWAEITNAPRFEMGPGFAIVVVALFSAPLFGLFCLCLNCILEGRVLRRWIVGQVVAVPVLLLVALVLDELLGF